MVCIDNSDYTRNGDYAPTRFVSQTEAVQLVCSSKTLQNPENSVGMLTTAGDRIEVMITPTSDLGRMAAELAKIQPNGVADLLRGIQTAQLALKHRQNKNQKQRIVAFVGSPVTATEKELETLGKNLKKNNVSLDLVSFGEVEENTPKLDKLLNAVNSNESSHVLTVPVGPKLLSDVLLSSPILAGEGEAGVAAAGGGDAGFEFGINPADDPELALALRISMEEERARQQAADGGAPAEGGAAAAPGAEGAAGAAAPEAAPADGTAAPAAAAAPAPAAAAPLPMADNADVLGAMDMDDMDEELRAALLLSLQEAEPMDAAAAEAPAAATDAAPAAAAEAAPAAAPAPAETAAAPAAAAPAPAAAEVAPPVEKKDAEMTDAAATTEAPKSAEEDAKIDGNWFQDPDFVNELLGSLPGVDIQDPRIQNALKEVGGDAKGKEGDGSGSGDASGSGDKK